MEMRPHEAIIENNPDTTSSEEQRDVEKGKWSGETLGESGDGGARRIEKVMGMEVAMVMKLCIIDSQIHMKVPG